MFIFSSKLIRGLFSEHHITPFYRNPKKQTHFVPIRLQFFAPHFLLLPLLLRLHLLLFLLPYFLFNYSTVCNLRHCSYILTLFPFLFSSHGRQVGTYRNVFQTPQSPFMVYIQVCQLTIFFFFFFLAGVEPKLYK